MATCRDPRAHLLETAGFQEGGGTPLHWAARYQSEEGAEAVIRCLIEAGADVNAKDTTNGATPLHWAALNIDQFAGTVAAKALIAAGADVNACTNNGTSVG